MDRKQDGPAQTGGACIPNARERQMGQKQKAETIMLANWTMQVSLSSEGDRNNLIVQFQLPTKKNENWDTIIQGPLSLG